MKTLLILSTILVSSLSGNLFAQHEHASGSGSATIKRTPILQQLLNEKGISNREVTMAIVDLPPNSVAAAHRHPCPTFGYVLEGEIESVFEGKTYLYKKGDSFYEVTNGLHSSARNMHPTIPAKLLVFYLAESGKPTSIPEK